MTYLLIALNLATSHAALTRGDNRAGAFVHHGSVVSIQPLRFDDGHVTYVLSPKVAKDPRNQSAVGAGGDQKVDLYFGDDDVVSAERTNVEGVR